MNFVRGRGNRRENIITIPTGEYVRKAPQQEQDAVRAFVCDAIGIPSTIHPIDAPVA